jgi:hypothetical protein
MAQSPLASALALKQGGTMGKHYSPEPWAILPQRADMIKSDKDGSHVLECIGHRTHERTQANAARIVACVNACEGMQDPAKEIEQLQLDKADLIESLSMALTILERDASCQFTYRMLKAKLDKIRGVIK